MSLPSQYRMPMRMVTGLGVRVVRRSYSSLVRMWHVDCCRWHSHRCAMPKHYQPVGRWLDLDNPLFTKMFTAYANATCNVQVTYNSVGSGAGVRNSSLERPWP